MYIKKIRNRSGSTSVIISEKNKGQYRKLYTVGIAREEWEIEELVKEGREWIRRHKPERQPELDLYGEERRILESEMETAARLSPSTMKGYRRMHAGTG